MHAHTKKENRKGKGEVLLCWTCLDFSVFLQQASEPLHIFQDHTVWAAFCMLLFPSSNRCFRVIPFAVVTLRGCSPWCSHPSPQGMPVLGWRVWFRGMKFPPILAVLQCNVLASSDRDPSFRVRNLSQSGPRLQPHPMSLVTESRNGLGMKARPHAGTCLSTSLLLECKEALRAD